MTQSIKWLAGIDPDVEWGIRPVPGPFATRAAAVAAIAAEDECWTPDPYGAEPHPWVMPVVAEGLYGWMPDGCTCYGATTCAACTLAREYVTTAEVRGALASEAGPPPARR